MRWTDSSVRWTRFSPRGWAALGVAGAVALLSGCVVAPVDDGYADYGYSSTTVYTTYGYPPPPARGVPHCGPRAQLHLDWRGLVLDRQPL